MNSYLYRVCYSLKLKLILALHWDIILYHFLNFEWFRFIPLSIAICIYNYYNFLLCCSSLTLFFLMHDFEICRCLQARCHYLDGGCLSSPRWSSLLVAEIYYPEAVLSSSDTVNPPRSPVSASQPPSVQDFQVSTSQYHQYFCYCFSK